MPARSPNYPAIGLSEAVTLIERLWRAEGGSTIPVTSAVEALGYKGLSGPSRTKLSGLRKYGLIEGRGDDIRITDLGKRIAKPISEQERGTALAEAAHTPDLFRDLASRYPDASDNTLQAVLERQGFSRDGARRAVAAFRDAAAVASLSSEGYDGEDGELDADAEADSPARDQRRREREPGMTVLSFQISDRLVEVAVPGGPLTKDEISILREYLTIQERVAPASREPEAAPEADPAGSID